MCPDRRGRFIPETSKEWLGRVTLGKGSSKEEGKKTEHGTARGREGDTKRERQRVSVTIFSGIYCAREVYILF